MSRTASFNPLPSPKQGETGYDASVWSGLRSFNPLPSPKQGETDFLERRRMTGCVSIRSPHRSKGRRFRAPRSNAQGRVSIRSPHRSKGRRFLESPIFQALFVSIRSPHRSKGRPTTPLLCRSRRLFQSAPLTEARGDKSAKAPKICLPLFQSAPLTEARGDVRARCGASYVLCFNPLPSPKQGETSLSV